MRDGDLIIVFAHVLTIGPFGGILGPLELVDHFQGFQVGQGLFLAVEAAYGVQIVVGAGGLLLQIDVLKFQGRCGLGSRLREGDTESWGKVGHLGLMLYAVYSLKTGELQNYYIL